MVPQWAVDTSVGFQVVDGSSGKWLGDYGSKAITVNPSSPNSLHVSDTLPDTMITGEKYNVSVNFTNTGNTPWTSERGDVLAMWGQTWNLEMNSDTTLYSLPAWSIPEGVTVMPGQTYTWNLTMVPQWPANTNIGFQVVQTHNWMSGSDKWLGDYGGKVVVVNPASPNSLHVSDSMPGTMIAGERYNFTVNYTNTGNTPWTSSRGDVLAMWGQTWNLDMNSDNTLYSLQAWGIPEGVSVMPGQTYTWNLSVVAQWPVGTSIGFQVVQKNNWMSGSEKWLGDYGGEVINVDPASPSSLYVSDSIPGTMSTGTSYHVRVNFTNNGNTPWTPARGDMLVMWGQTWNLEMNNDTELYGLPSWNIPANIKVMPGETYSWDLTLKPQWAVSTSIGFQVVQKNNWMTSSEKWLGNYGSKTLVVN